jgi:hypothetical protein
LLEGYKTAVAESQKVDSTKQLWSTLWSLPGISPYLPKE